MEPIIKNGMMIPENFEVKRVDHLPIVSAVCQNIGLIETVNQLVPTEMAVDVGTVVQAMVIDTLSGRSPLYRMEEFMTQMDSELLLGKTVAAKSFNDTTLGRVLDAIFKSGTWRLFSEISLKAAQVYPIDKRYVHFDTTSVNVWGDYENSDEGESGEAIKITNGYSKAHRPDLKQFLIQMLCDARNIPILGGCADGNASDKRLNYDVLKRVSEHMARFDLKKGDYVFVSDSAMVTEDNLNIMGGNKFISRQPFTYAETNRVVLEAVRDGNWTEVGRLNETETSPAHPPASYRVSENWVTLYEMKYRVVVVHSSAYDKRRHKRLDREIKESASQAAKMMDAATAVEYFCLEDAEAALTRMQEEQTDYHCLNGEVMAVPRYAKGRPVKDQPRQIASVRYRLQGNVGEKTPAIQRRREEAGCFVLVTNVDGEGEKAIKGGEILRIYKDQHGIERNFSFIKDPAIINSIFLKKPEHIEVLGLILLISLLVWNLIESSLRIYVNSKGVKLPGWDNKSTAHPTSFMLMTKFAGLNVLRFGHKRIFGSQFSPTQSNYLEALGFPPDIYLTPFKSTEKKYLAPA